MRSRTGVTRLEVVSIGLFAAVLAGLGLMGERDFGGRPAVIMIATLSIAVVSMLQSCPPCRSRLGSGGSSIRGFGRESTIAALFFNERNVTGIAHHDVTRVLTPSITTVGRPRPACPEGRMTMRSRHVSNARENVRL